MNVIFGICQKEDSLLEDKSRDINSQIAQNRSIENLHSFYMGNDKNMGRGPLLFVLS